MSTKTITAKDINLFQEIEKQINSKRYDPKLIEKKLINFIGKKEKEKNYLHYYYTASYLSDIGSIDIAGQYFTKCTELEPNFPDVYYTVGLLHFKNKNYDAAFEFVSKAYQLGFRNDLIHGIIGTCLSFKKGSMPIKALEFFEEQKKLFPKTFIGFQHVYALTLRNIGEADKATQELINLISNQPHKSKGLYADLMMTFVHSSKFTDEDLLKIAIACDQNIFPTTKHNFKHDRRLDKEFPRVGVIFPYTENSVAHWLLELFKNRNKNFFYVAYHNASVIDNDTKKIEENVDLFRNIYAMNAEEAAKLIYDDEIDVLFDIRTHVHGDRLDVIKLKPSPVQVNWLDSIPPTGSPEMDYTITDNYIILPETDKFFTEKVYRLPSSYFYYKEPDYEIEVKDPPCLENGYITFGSFHRSSKINPELLKTWAKILRGVDKSKLLIKNGRVGEDAYRQRILGIFKQEGIEADRIILEEFEEMKKFFQKCNEVDICLDSFPLNGASTNLRTFWMSKPLIIIEGKKRPGRISYSALKNLGLDELIAANEEEYINLAIELANSPERITEYTRSIRKKLVDSDICNTPKFQSQLEEAIMFMWDEFRNYSGVISKERSD